MIKIPELEKENRTSKNVNEENPSLHLPNQSYNFNQQLNLRENYDVSSIKKKLSIELFKELENSPISDEEKEQYKNLKEKIEQGNYYFCYDDINGIDNLNFTNILKENGQIIENPILIKLPDEINYDVNLIKIGKKCKGVKKRFAIIKRRGFFSSQKPKNEADPNKLKDKTKYLENCVIIREVYPIQKSEGEWHVKSKHYRIRINYIIDPKDIKQEMSSFYLYFENEKEMTEVYYMIFGFRSYTKIDNLLGKFNKNLIDGNTFYTIMKILSVKNKIKKRKLVFNKIESVIKGKIFGKLNWDETKLKELSEKRKHNSDLSSRNILRKLPIKKKQFQRQFSDFMPLISNASNNHIALKKDKRSLNDLIQKYKSLKEEIPEDIIENNNLELTDTGTCFCIPNGIQIEKNNENNLKLSPELCNNAKFIYFDKNTPEIIFKNDNNNINDDEVEGEVWEKNTELNKLSDINIYEISNIILNSNMDMNEIDENNLVICGPKIDNDKGITYDYQNKNYLDPENFSIKAKTFNLYNKKQIKGKTIQIYQCELDINDEKIKDLLVSLRGTTKLFDNFKENFLFGYKIRISDLKSIESLYVSPKEYNNGICFIEFNHQYFIPDELLNDSPLIIELYGIPIASFSDKGNDISELDKGYIGKLLSPIQIGYAKVTNEDINKGILKYSIIEEDIDIANNNLIIDGMSESIESIKLKKKIQGKDYSIGNDSFLEKFINKELIINAKENPDISDEIKERYFNMEFDGDDFLFRPNPEMNEEEFKNEICQQITEETYSKIKSNEKYNFLPCCEKYNEDSLLRSKNLKILTEEQKKYIRENVKIGEWIYKAPKIKARFLSKNLGCNKEGISQFIYSTGEIENLPMETLVKQNETKVIPINENDFNIIDMKEIDNIENVDNFQWKTGIKFNNSLQLHSFLKLLTLARQNINTKENNKKENKESDFDPDKIFDFENKRDAKDNERLSTKNYEIKISFINFTNKIQLKYDPTYLKSNLLIEGNEINDGEKKKKLYSLFKNSDYNFQNSLIDNIPKLKEKIKDSIKDNRNQNIYNFIPVILKKDKIDKFNNGKRYLYFADALKKEIKLKNSIDKFEIRIFKSNKNETYKNEYKSIVELSKFKTNNDIICNKVELPIYKENDENKNKIYGNIGIELYEKQNPNTNFEDEFEKAYKEYLDSPILILKDQFNTNFNFQVEDYHFGLYEPNIYRRKILNSIHDSEGIGVNPNDMENNVKQELDILYEKLIKKNCLELPERPSFSSFKFYDSKKNFEIYKKKLGKKLLKYRAHEEFLKIFRNSEWEIYINKMNKDIRKTSYQYLENIPDKKVLIENEDETKTLYNLIYEGIPTKEYRNIIYNMFLETKKLYEETKNILNEKECVYLNGEKEIFEYFLDQLSKIEEKSNLIFSLIDNDSTFLYSLGGTTLNDIKEIKKIAKSFFIWAKYKIGLEENDKYVYFIGLLSIIQKLRNYFKENYIVFWLLVGLSQYIDHFHQPNPLFTDKMNYINLYGLVSKLILETHQKEIYNKFISLNFPPEFFLSQHLSTLYTDYFNEELMMRIFDILIFECSFKNINNDKLQYLRILCAIPITLLELNKKRILACESVSELETIFNDLILRALNHNKFVYLLDKNFKKFYVFSSFFEKWIWFLNNKGREWDSKRADLENLISEHFKPVYKENINYLNEINRLLHIDAQKFFNDYKDNLNKKIPLVKSVYYQQESLYDDFNMKTSLFIHISKLQQIYNNPNRDIDEYKLFISFRNDILKNGNYDETEIDIHFDSNNNKIKNINDLFFKEHFEKYNFPKFIYFELKDINGNTISTFIYQILNLEPMKISKIILENLEATEKYYLEFVLFKATNKKLGEDINLYNVIFSPPEYIHSKSIEEKLNNYSVSNYFFNEKISELIKEENKNLNSILYYNTFNDSLVDIFKQLNNKERIEDKYNIINYKNSERNIQRKINEILNLFVQEDIKKYINNWLTETNISIEEILYSIILIDNSLNSINEKLYLLYSIAQTKDSVLFNNERLSINKLKEMIYSLYKRFMIYFTKTEVERMIDFLMKDERLFNIKYAFIYNNKDSNKINDFIYDKDRYMPKLDSKREFEIFYDNIDKQLNIYLNHLNNHYNMNSFSTKILTYILTDILKNNINLNKYINHDFNIITLVVEKDSIMYKRNYNIISYSPLEIKEEKDSLFNPNPSNENEIIDNLLCSEISNFDTYNNYTVNNFISFEKFKEIFFKLPYLSDLFRVSFSYINVNDNSFQKDFDCLKLSIDFEDIISTDEYVIKNSYVNINNKNNNYGIFYFPSSEEENEIISGDNERKIYNMNTKINLSNSIDNIVSKIIDKFDNQIILNKNEKFLIEQLKSFDKIICYVYFYSDDVGKQNINIKKIGYFDRLFSFAELKDKNFVGIKLILNPDIFSVNNSNTKKIFERKNGYCKIYYSKNNDEFMWKKCKIKGIDKSNVKLTSKDYSSKPKVVNNDVVFAYNL